MSGAFLTRTVKRSAKSILQVFVPKRVIMWRGNRRDGKDIAITFDDGPNPLYTGKFMDILEDYGIKATFFLSGNEVEKYPELARELVKRKHSIGNHTYSHRDISLLDSRELRYEIQLAQSTIQTVTGVRPTIFRPPRGRIAVNGIMHCIKSRLPVVLWSVDSMDHTRSGVSSILSMVNANTVKPGDIILFHDDNDYTLTALPIVIETLSGKSYNFVTVEQMLIRNNFLSR